MTDGISSALVSPLARNSSANDRSALVGNDEQADFDRALFSPEKDAPKSKGQHLDADAPREQRWHKLAERLAAPAPGEPEARNGVARDKLAAKGDETDKVELPLPEQATAEVGDPETTGAAALPLVLALSELRKAGSQSGTAEPVDATATSGEHADATGEPAADRPPVGFGNSSSRSATTGATLPQGLAALAAGTEVSTEASSAQDPSPTQALGDVAADADKPARPAQAKQPEQPIGAGRVSVLSEQAIPAPANTGTNSTAGALALAIASEAPQKSALASAAQALQASTSSAPAAHVLKIQLRPVELGTVTASLHLSGEQLSVEIEVENAEAYHRLSADRDAITSALRGLGFDVDRVTIQQPQSGTPTPSRGDGGGTSAGFGDRDQAAFQSGGSGGEGGSSGDGRPGRRATNEDGNARNISSSGTDHPGSSRYI